MFPLKIFSIDREIFVGDAKSLIVPGVTGELQILPEHTSLVSLLKEGDLVIEDSTGKTENIPISGGTVEVTEKDVVVLAKF